MSTHFLLAKNIWRTNFYMMMGTPVIISDVITFCSYQIWMGFLVSFGVSLKNLDFYLYLGVFNMTNSNQLNEVVRSHITGIGAYFPQQIIKSDELMAEAQSKKFGIPESFLQRASGIIERRFSTEKETYALMAIAASRNAIDEAGIDPLDIDLVLFCGIDKDYSEPATAHEVQIGVGAHNSECMDVSNACIGMLSGYKIADAYIRTGIAETVLVCSGEKPSIVALDVVRQLRETTDKTTFRRLMGALTLGDAGGAFVVSRKTDGKGMLYSRFRSDGRYRELCYYGLTKDGWKFEMQMEKISIAMVSHHEEMIDETYSKIGWNPDQIGKVYCHQVGERPHSQMVELSKVAPECCPRTYAEFGNLTSVTFAVNMTLNKPKKGEKVLFLGAGSGATMCQSVFQF